MDKKRNLFLWLSFTVFILSVIAVILHMVFSYYRVKTDFPNDTQRITDELVAMVFVSACITVPCLGSQLSCIRSVYRTLKYKPRGVVKICWLVSAILSFSAFVFLVLTFTGVLDFTKDSGSLKLQETVLLLTGWPIVIMSLILGSVPMKKKGDYK